MATRAQRADQIVRAIAQRARREALRRALETDGQITRAWEPILRRLHQRLGTATSAQVPILVEQAGRELAQAALPHTEAAIRDAVSIGTTAGEAQHRALTGPAGPMPAPVFAEARIAAFTERALVASIIAGAHVPDRIGISTRLYRNLADTAQSASRIVRSGIEAREGIFRTSERFIAANRENLQVERPRYVDDLAAAARRSLDTGDRRHLEDVIAQHVRSLDRLGGGSDTEFSLRSSVRQFVQELRRATPERITQVVNRHLEDRAQYQARRLVATETVEAHRRAYRQSVDDRPYVKGLRWNLSGAHPKVDVCNTYAEQALHGLGPGGYPRDQFPETPHSFCTCIPTSITDVDHFTRELARAEGREEPPRRWEDPRRITPQDWAATLTPAQRLELLGPTRARIFDSGPEGRARVMDARGNPIPVHQVLGTPPPRRDVNVVRLPIAI